MTTADGLGHGRDAAVASAAAVEAASNAAEGDPRSVLHAVNERLRTTRGAAVTVARLDLGALRSGGQLDSSGLGNVSLLVVGPDGASRRVLTAHGTAGARATTTTSEQSTPFPAGGAMILHTDGLLSRWSLEGRGALLRHGAQTIAATLWRDHLRGTDDSLIVVVKTAGASV